MVARYLNLPFKRTLTKYLLWYGSQFLIIAGCSSKYTFVLSFLLVPIFALIDWILLLRDTSFLTRVIKSNLRSIQFLYSNQSIYRQELSNFKFYRFFRIFLLVFALSSFLAIISHYVLSILNIIGDDFCLLRQVYHLDIPIHLSLSYRNLAFIRDLVFFVEDLLMIIQGSSLCIPLLIMMISPVVYKCVKRCKEREDQYRFNYERFETLLPNNKH